MNKKIVIILVIIVILVNVFIVYKAIKEPSIFKDEYYIVDLEKSDITLTKEDKEKIIMFCGPENRKIKEKEDIKITKLAYKYGGQHEGTCCIFFKTNLDVKIPFFRLIRVTEDSKEYLTEHICMDTINCEEYKYIKKIVIDNYKWWKENEKKIDYKKIEEPYRTEEKDSLLVKKYEVVTGENFQGTIIDITDKYIVIKNDHSDIKLVKINWNKTNFWNDSTNEPMTIYDLKVGDYFYNKFIIPAV